MVSASATSRSADGTVTVSPRDEASQSALVVFCHGLGDTSEGFADVAEVRTAVQKKKGRRNERRRYQQSPSGSFASRFY
jgi:predicted esterase